MILQNTLAILIVLASQRAAGQLSRNFFVDTNRGDLSLPYNPGNAVLNNGVAYLNQDGLNTLPRCMPLRNYPTANSLPNPGRSVKGPYKIVIQSQGQSRIETADENGNVRGVVYYVDPQYGYPKTISYEGNLASGIRKSSFSDPSQPFYPNRLVSPFLNYNDISQNNSGDDDSVNVVNAFFNGKVRPNTNNPLSLSGLQSQQYLQQLQRLSANPASPFLQSAQLNSLVPGQNFPVNPFANVNQFLTTEQPPFNPLASLPFSPQTDQLQKLQLPINGLNQFTNGQRDLPIRPNLSFGPPQVLQTLGRIQQQDPQSVSFGGNIQSRTAGDGSRGVINGRFSWLGNNEQSQDTLSDQEEQDNFIQASNSYVRPSFSNLVPNSLINQAGNQFPVNNLAGLPNPANIGSVNEFPIGSPLPRPVAQAIPPNLGQLANVANLPGNTQGNNQGRTQSAPRQQSAPSQQGSESGAQKSDLDYEVLVDIADKIAKLARSKSTEETSTSEGP